MRGLAPALEFIGGGTVGLIFSELYKAVGNLIKKTKKFSPQLKAIKATVDALKPVIDQIEEQNKELNLSNDETKNLKNIISDGIKLVGDCSKNPNWYRKISYTAKLTDLDEALKRQLEILKVQGLRDKKETLIWVRELNEEIREINEEIREINEKINQLCWSSVINLVLSLVLIFLIWNCGVPGGVREQQLATSSALSLPAVQYCPVRRG